MTQRVLESRGYGGYFVLRAGHGRGLETREPPWIMAGNDEVLVRRSLI